MKLTLIRHAPTSYSKPGLFMGHLDIPATPEGLVSATELGKSVGSINASCYVSSPLSRALQTANCVFPDAQIEIDNDLIERGLGSWAGLSKAEVREKYGEAFLPSGFIDPYYTPPNGETIEDMIRRVDRFIKKLETNPESEHVVAVTHNGVIRLIRCLIEDIPIKDMFVDSEPYLSVRTYTYSKFNKWKQIALTTNNQSGNGLL